MDSQFYENIIMGNNYFKSSNSFKEIIILGDFNIPLIDWKTCTSNYAEDHFGSRILGFCASEFFNQLIPFSTRFRNDKSSMLDLLFVKDPYLMSEIRCGPPIDKSDHCVIEFSLNISCHDRYIDECVLDFKNADYTLINKFLEGFDWMGRFEHNDHFIEDYNDFQRFIMSVVKFFVPCNKKKRRSEGHKWFNSELQKLKKMRNSAFAAYKCKKNLDNWNCYKELRNRFIRLLRKAKLEFDKSILDGAKEDVKILYNHVRKSNKNIPKTINCIEIDGKLVENLQEIAEEFGSKFSDYNKNKDKANSLINIHSNNSTEIIYTNREEIEFIIDSLSNSYSVSLDNISNFFIKNCRMFFVNVMVKIINISLSTGLIPDSWRLGMIIPKFKRGSRFDIDNYRPITLTSCLAKISERVILRRLDNFIIRSNILSNNQYGFRKGFSCEANLLSTMNDWTKYRDNGYSVNVIFFDFSKAFDNVDHKILLNKLIDIDLDGYIFNWIKSFLNNRSVCVGIGKINSRFYELSKGVPQGAVLSAALFNLFTADIEIGIKSKIKIYADDVKIYYKNKNGKDDFLLQNDINRICEWSNKNKLCINVEKCAHLVIGRNTNSKFYLNDIVINKVKYYKELGIWFDDKLCFSVHVDAIIKKLNSKMGIIKKTFDYINCEIFKKIYLIYLQPVIDYCRVVWLIVYEKDKLKLNRCVRRYTKLVNGLYTIDYEMRMKRIGILSPSQRALRGDMIFLFKWFKNNSNRENLFILKDYKRLRRHAFTISKENCKRDIRANFITNRAVNFWNLLPDCVVLADSINIFKNRLDSFMTTSKLFKELI